MTVYFQIEDYLFQVIPEKDLCFIFKNGRPVWSGNRDQLIEILNQAII